MPNPNLQLLVDAAKLLKPILEELVFVGGCTTALLIADKAAAFQSHLCREDIMRRVTVILTRQDNSKREFSINAADCLMQRTNLSGRYGSSGGTTRSESEKNERKSV